MGRGKKQNKRAFRRPPTERPKDPEDDGMPELMDVPDDMIASMSVTHLSGSIYKDSKEEDLKGAAVGAFLPSDGKQYPLKGDVSQRLIQKWITFRTINREDLSSLQLPFFDGDLNAITFMEELPANFKHTLETASRFSKNNYHLLHLVIRGAAMEVWTGKFHKHVECLKIMLKYCTKELLEVKDILGHSPLYSAIIDSKNPKVMQMAEMLLEAGCTVDSKNRFGSIPLSEAVFAENIPAIRLLIKYKSLPFEEDFRGLTPVDIAEKKAARYHPHDPRHEKAKNVVREI
ncbi:hypothetical protein HDV05_000384, partial [Chytridiales sp. JEL 0842]